MSTKLLLWFGVYFICLIIYQILSHIEYRKDPEKMARYQSLPLRFKLACAFVGIPIFTTSIYGFLENNDYLKFLWILAFIFAMYLENKAVVWYRDNGML